MIFNKSNILLILPLALLLSGCGRGSGAAIKAYPQTIHFGTAPALILPGSTTVAASASSGLAIAYSSSTPGVCSVGSTSGLVTGISAGNCTIAADQSGNNNFAPAAQVKQNITVLPDPNATAAVSAPSATVDGGITYRITATFYEPDTQPNNSIFSGTFTLNPLTGAVSNLQGTLTESMTHINDGIPMNTVTLTHQLSAVPDGAGGLLVTTFALNTTHTFTDTPALGGSDGWAPGSGNGLYYGFPSPASHPSLGAAGNAYTMVYIHLADPTLPLTPMQLARIAYADCTAMGMMGDVCMTGTSVAGYGTIGTMSGYPISQTVTKQ